ncbi:MAG: TIGR03915 family putative DNA repair protein [Bacteroidales bacterium]|nr:TIGR03915 family putative DNA repair protein [Clostridium sp.]MCM1202845.1 TIGR03915 family putative DNA repair protein [Bacteroidales bacterium]
MENRMIYLCEDTPDGVFSAVYDAWAAHIPEERLSLQAERNHAMQLFADYVYVQTDLEKAVKVARSVRSKLGGEAYEMMYKASLSYEEDKMDTIYRFLKLGFRFGSPVVKMHGEDVVCRMFELRRNVWNEAHSFREFVRFRESEEGVLISRIRPKNQVLPLLAEHFTDRFPEENFVILDEEHGMGLFHEKGGMWYLAPLLREALDRIWQHANSMEYEKLWKTFFRTIAVEERTNYRCQRNMCALRYRDYMIEFH